MQITRNYRKFQSFTWRLFGLTFVLFVTACSLPEPASPLLCPNVAILSGSDRLIQFRPGAQKDILDIQIEADISKLVFACQFYDNHVRVNTSFQIKAHLGLKSKVDTVSVPFFVAIINPKGDIIAKKVFKSVLSFPKKHRNAVIQEKVTQQVPLSNPSLASKYQVLVGFQLTSAQLEYNEARY